MISTISMIYSVICPAGKPSTPRFFGTIGDEVGARSRHSQPRVLGSKMSLPAGHARHVEIGGIQGQAGCGRGVSSV